MYQPNNVGMPNAVNASSPIALQMAECLQLDKLEVNGQGRCSPDLIVSAKTNEVGFGKACQGRNVIRRPEPQARNATASSGSWSTTRGVGSGTMRKTFLRWMRVGA